MADCITSYRGCLESLYEEYKEALGVNPAKAASLNKKMVKACTISAAYWAADAGADESEKVIQCARMRAIFTGDTCLDAVYSGSSASIESGLFTYVDLDGSYDLVINHSLGTSLIASVVAIDPDGILEDTLPKTIVSDDTIVLSFGGAIAAGQWTWIVTAQPII